eukprot:PhM_4_TR17457/c2_g3_i1/m.36646
MSSTTTTVETNTLIGGHLEATRKDEATFHSLVTFIKDSYYTPVADNFEVKARFLKPVFGNFLAVCELVEKLRGVLAAGSGGGVEDVLEMVHQHVVVFEEAATHFATSTLPVVWHISDAPKLEYLLERINIDDALSVPIARAMPPFRNLLTHVSPQVRSFVSALGAVASRLSWYASTALRLRHPSAQDFHVVAWRVAANIHTAICALRSEATSKHIRNYASLPRRDDAREFLYTCYVSKMAARGRRHRQVFLCSDMLFYCEVVGDRQYKMKDYVHFAHAVKIQALPDNIPRQQFNILQVEQEKKKFIFMFDTVHERDHMHSLAQQAVRAKGSLENYYKDMISTVVWPSTTHPHPTLARRSSSNTIKCVSSRTVTPMVYSEPSTPRVDNRPTLPSAVNTPGSTTAGAHAFQQQQQQQQQPSVAPSVTPSVVSSAVNNNNNNNTNQGGTTTTAGTHHRRTNSAGVGGFSAASGSTYVEASGRPSTAYSSMFNIAGDLDDVATRLSYSTADGRPSTSNPTTTASSSTATTTAPTSGGLQPPPRQREPQRTSVRSSTEPSGGSGGDKSVSIEGLAQTLGVKSTSTTPTTVPQSVGAALDGAVPPSNAPITTPPIEFLQTIVSPSSVSVGGMSPRFSIDVTTANQYSGSASAAASPSIMPLGPSKLSGETTNVQSSGGQLSLPHHGAANANNIGAGASSSAAPSSVVTFVGMDTRQDSK